MRRRRFGPESVFRAVSGVFRRVRGAYSVVALIHGQGLLAFRDPFGIKRSPLASAARVRVCFRERRVRPARVQAVPRRCRRRSSLRRQPAPCPHPADKARRTRTCISSTSTSLGRLGDRRRRGLRGPAAPGRALAAEVARQGVKRTSSCGARHRSSAASSLASTLGIELREGLIKNRYIARTFIMHGQDRGPFGPPEAQPGPFQVQGKDVMLVDDSIVRGTTSREIVQMVRDAGARKFFSPSRTAAPVPCVYGIDMMTRGEFAAKNRTASRSAGSSARRTCVSDVRRTRVGVRATRESRFCTACFNGQYRPASPPTSRADGARAQRWLQ